MNRLNNAILVTGIHRSGSTWVGNMLALSPDLIYIHEPFQVGLKRINKRGVFTHWFEFLDDSESETRIFEVLNFINSLTFLGDADIKDFKTKQIHKLKRTLRNAFKKLLFNFFPKRILIKDPIAVLSTEWLSKNIQNLKVVVLIRRPEAFVSSLKQLNWHFDFNELLQQEKLMNTFSVEDKKTIKHLSESKPDIIEQGTFLWNIIYKRIYEIKQIKNDWLFIRYEDIIGDPNTYFKKIYNYCNLDFTPKIASRINSYTNSAKSNGLKKNSLEQNEIWKKRLEIEEIERIFHYSSELMELWEY